MASSISAPARGAGPDARTDDPARGPRAAAPRAPDPLARMNGSTLAPTFVSTAYTDVVAHTNSVRQSSPPQCRFAAISGMRTVPSSAPRGE